MTGFCHLNLHSDRSQFLGMIKPNKLAALMAQRGVNAACVTDHGNISIAIELRNACKQHSLKPIYGMEVNVVNDKTKKEKGSKNLVLLAKNIQGFRDLIILATLGNMYFYYKPRIDFTDLEKYGEDLIALTACRYGVTASEFWDYGQDGLTACYEKYKTLFGDNLFVEIEPTIIDSQRIYNEACGKLSKATSAKLVATGNPHYLNPDDREFHEHFVAIKVIGGKDDWVYPFPGDYSVKDYEQMQGQFAQLHGYDISMIQCFKDAMDRPNEIIDMVDSFDLTDSVKTPTYFI